MAPPACSDLLASCARSFNPRLQGGMLLYALATPTIGLSKSAPAKPTARNMARLGARSTPCVMALLLRSLMRFQFEVRGEALQRKRAKVHARLCPRNATSGGNANRARKWRQNTLLGSRRVAGPAFLFPSSPPSPSENAPPPPPYPSGRVPPLSAGSPMADGLLPSSIPT